MKLTHLSVLISFLILWACSCLLIYLTDHLILTPEFYDRSGNVFFLNGRDSSDFFASLQRWSFLFEGVYVLLKMLAITIVISTGLYCYNQKLRFYRVFHVVILCEFVFLLAALVKILWFAHWYPDGTLLDWHRTYPLSALWFFPQIPADWYYSLQLLNLFELVYWFLLAFGISKITPLNFDYSLKIILSSYVPALIIWTVGVLFSSLLVFPSQG